MDLHPPRMAFRIDLDALGEILFAQHVREPFPDAPAHAVDPVHLRSSQPRHNAQDFVGHLDGSHIVRVRTVFQLRLLFYFFVVHRLLLKRKFIHFNYFIIPYPGECG